MLTLFRSIFIVYPTPFFVSIEFVSYMNIVYYTIALSLFPNDTLSSGDIIPVERRRKDILETQLSNASQHYYNNNNNVVKRN